MIKVIYNKVCGRCVQSEPLTSGMVGQPIHFEYSYDFDGLAVTAVFTDGKNTVDVVNPGNECVIPHEVLTTVGAIVKVGIYAVRGEELVIPTVYATIGVVLKGADPSGDVSADPTLPVWAQIQALMGNLSDLNTEAKNNLVAAINEAAQAGSGSASIAMRVDGGYIQYSTDNGKTWVNLIAEADLKGDKGDPGSPGKDGHSPVVTATKSGKTTTISVDGTAIATVEDGTDGAPGVAGTPGKDGTSITISGISESAADGGTNTVTFSDGSALKVKNGSKGSAGADGTDGITPHIGDNGNWYLGDTDTGKPSRGETGAQGPAGADGKSAYAYAVEGGYAGTEEEFTARMAAEIPTVDSTLTQSGKAADAKAVGDALAGKQDTLIQIGASVGQIAKITAVDDTGKPTAWEAADMQSNVQPDWNQNDDSHPDYVKNRPFYTGSPVDTVLVEESTVSFDIADGAYMGELKSTFSATVGETYKVSWDGTVYECTCADFSGMTIIGNLSIVGAGSDTGEPFIMIVNNGQKIKIGTADTSASHTFSISGSQTPIVKIPAKYIDKDASGYIVIHKNNTMTEQEVQNYANAISKRQVVFIIWGSLCISTISVNTKPDSTGVSVVYLNVGTPNGESYNIVQNSNGLFGLIDRKLVYSNFPNNKVVGDPSAEISIAEGKIKIIPSRTDSGVGTTDALFYVQPNGIKSKSFEVLGNGEAVAPALILYSSTADSTKKFKITVDDNGTLSATEVTE